MTDKQDRHDREATADPQPESIDDAITNALLSCVPAPGPGYWDRIVGAVAFLGLRNDGPNRQSVVVADSVTPDSDPTPTSVEPTPAPTMTEAGFITVEDAAALGLDAIFCSFRLGELGDEFGPGLSPDYLFLGGLDQWIMILDGEPVSLKPAAGAGEIAYWTVTEFTGDGYRVAFTELSEPVATSIDGILGCGV